ncbi:hypothetical protein SDC9_134842 [bioreactor metagenome]|uniref:Uncharacterized protein n=1 Tax=bioreactor metagenome TaxID=1076179 RepID=A0A645DGP0_9ZZZZ
MQGGGSGEDELGGLAPVIDPAAAGYRYLHGTRDLQHGTQRDRFYHMPRKAARGADAAGVHARAESLKIYAGHRAYSIDGADRVGPALLRERRGVDDVR